jgi:hypothetical protein
MGVRTFSSFGNARTCACGHTMEDDDVAHALGCNRLSGLVQSRHNGTAEVLREFVGRLGFSSICEGQYSRLAPRTRTAPRRAGTSTATCALAPAKCSPMSPSFILSLLHTFVPRLAPLATQPLFGTLANAETATRTTNALGVRSVRYPLRPRCGSALAPCSSSAKPPTPPFPSLATSVLPASPTFTGSYRWYHTAGGGLQMGSGWICGMPHATSEILY